MHELYSPSPPQRGGAGLTDGWLFHFYSVMDPEGGNPKTFVSTFRLALKPQARRARVETQREDGPEATKGTSAGNEKLGVSSAAGKDPENR